MYEQFAHQYLKQICDAFPGHWVKVYHNDANIKSFLAYLPDTGFDVLNFTHNLDIAEVRTKTGGLICLMFAIETRGRLLEELSPPVVR